MERELVPCVSCAELVFAGTCLCPHCGHKHPCHRKHLAAGAMLLGLSVAAPGCGGVMQSDYSASVTDDTGWVDNDDDGYSIDEGDCDDDDPDIHPGADETPGDGVDSNCNDDDDT